MSDLLSVIKAHAQPDLRRKILVPEWSIDGEKPLIITYTMLTLDDLSVVYEAAQASTLSKSAPYVVAYKACDEAGERLFKLGDAVVLRQTAAPEVVTRIAMQMMGRTSIEDAEKN